MPEGFISHFMDQEYLDKFETRIGDALYNFLLSKEEIDKVPGASPDITEKGDQICAKYLPDGIREFQNYPTVSLGWMMFIGMAVARMWDDDWETYSKFENLYAVLVNARGYDNLDEHICEDILKLSGKEAESTSRLIGDAAEMVHALLIHEGIEPGTPTAYFAYIRCLLKLYFYGAAVELRRLGYHMTPLN